MIPMTREQVAVVNRALNLDHTVVSMGGWQCDTCGMSVNGQTDDSGLPLMEGDAVYHTFDPWDFRGGDR